MPGNSLESDLVRRLVDSVRVIPWIGLGNWGNKQKLAGSRSISHAKCKFNSEVSFSENCLKLQETP
jgi:hypothetical protein